MTDSSEPTIPGHLINSLDTEMAIVKEEIATRTKQLAGERSVTAAGLDDLATAVNETLGRKPVPVESRWCALLDGITPFTIVAATLCLTFAVLGYMADKSIEQAFKNSSQGFLDIAKIFAGAIVGAAASPVSALSKRKRREP